MLPLVLYLPNIINWNMKLDCNRQTITKFLSIITYN